MRKSYPIEEFYSEFRKKYIVCEVSLKQTVAVANAEELNKSF